MKNMLAFLAALVLTVVGVGWYLGWFEVSSKPSHHGHHQVNIDIDTTKVGDDLEKGKQALDDIVEKARKEHEGAATDKPGAPG
ncbi:MAG TPA: hypothetical protein VKE74_17010, partial [Gemmataceae bacterium]|nr:hypothetical protein [Gemmataceae bacterium]